MPARCGWTCTRTSVPSCSCPAETLSTHVARGLLPAAVPHADAAFNAARSALLVHALTRDPAMLLEATDDRLHQRQRAAAMPESIVLIDALRAHGLAAVVSGAGPSVLVLTARPGRRLRSPHSPHRGGRPSRWRSMQSGQRCWPGRLRYLLDNEEHTGTHRCCPVRELRLGSRRSRPLGRASRGAEADDLSSPLIRLASFRPVPFCVPAFGPDRKGPGHPLRWNAQVTAGKDLYVSETTDLVETGAQDAAGTTEAPAASGTTGSARRRGNGLSGMLLPELQRLAGELGISGTGRMRKGDLVAAISARQVGGSAPADAAPSASNGIRGPRRRGPRSRRHPGRAARGPRQRWRQRRPVDGSSGEAPESTRPVRTRRGASRPAGSPSADAPADAAPAAGTSDADTDERARRRRPHRRRPAAAQP